mgnify:CR=1 FL=1
MRRVSLGDASTEEHVLAFRLLQAMFLLLLVFNCCLKPIIKIDRTQYL